VPAHLQLSSISSAQRALSSKPASRPLALLIDGTDREIDGRPTITSTAYYASSQQKLTVMVVSNRLQP